MQSTATFSVFLKVYNNKIFKSLSRILTSIFVSPKIQMTLHRFPLCLKLQSLNGNSATDMGRFTLKSNALNKHYLPKTCIELALPLLDFEKVMH